MDPPKKESGDSPLVSGRTSGIVEKPISWGKGVVILSCGCGMGPPKKDLMERVDARLDLGCRNEKGNKERRGTSRGPFDEPFSCEKGFNGEVILLGSRECVTTSMKDS